MNNHKKLILLSLAILFFLPLASKAAEVKSGENIYLAKEESIDGSLYAASNNITIDGDINGDLIAAAQTITINGRLEGDLIAAAQTITVNGEINGNVRVASNNTTLNGKIARNVNFIGNTLIIGQEAEIGWDILTESINANIMGLIGGSVYGDGDNIILSGKIAKDFYFGNGHKMKNLAISPEAKINGNLYYNKDTQVKLGDQASVAGNIYPLETPERKDSLTPRLWSFTYFLFASFIIGLILITLSKKFVLNLNNILKEAPLASLGWGSLIFLATPAIAILLLLTIIGAPLALILITVWLLALWVGKIFTAIFIGSEIMKKITKEKYSEKNLLVAMIIGIIILRVLFIIPAIGWIISLLATCLSLGAIITYLRRQ